MYVITSPWDRVLGMFQEIVPFFFLFFLKIILFKRYGINYSESIWFGKWLKIDDILMIL